MLDKESARQEIASLVEKFRNDANRKTYNEDQTRHFFILPLFRALGWDTSSPAEFSAEEQISRGFVDFGFYLNGVPQFYLETKRVTERLDKVENIRQSINYSFLKGVTWAALSDFERLMVFNADWEEKDPRKAIFLDIEFEHYTNGAFDDLWLLSKEAMSERAIDKTAERYGKKAKKEPVTVSLFQDLTDWRKRLFSEIRLQATTIWASESRAVDNAVQKFFDRLIFIRTMEDRGIEAPRLIPLMRQKEQKFAFEDLLKLFRELDGIYNSNLFAEDKLDYLEVHDPILLKEIIDGLYKPKGKLLEYDFNAITADVLGAVYEQYLGFKAIDPHAETDTSKSKKRKQQGIYYTPQYVVRYIVQQTLGRLLQEGADPHALKIIDPACGSGSFLLEAFDVLDRWIANKEPDLPPQERRERILRENIFGVDLDEQAVEVTRLNLALRAAFERKKLPTFTNIKYGNSLIATDEIAGDGLGFDWQARFPEVFEAGGFDVVIGNPPYVRQETLGAAFKEYAKDLYSTYAGTADLYVYFMEKGFSILRETGRMGYIVPNKWLRANYGQALREFLKEKIDLLLDFGDLPVFAEATTYPLIVTMKKENPQPLTPSAILNEGGESLPLRTKQIETEDESLPLRSGGSSNPDEDENLPRFAHTRISQEIWAKLKPLTRDMRKDPTPAENFLWQKLWRKQVAGYKFRRQHPIGYFIADFYCADARLVIEVDGSIHEQQQEYDELHQAYIESLGLRVLRFENADVIQNMDGVLEKIAEALQEGKASPHPNPLPASQREGAIHTEKSLSIQSGGLTTPVQVLTVPALPESNQTLESILPRFYPVERSALDKKGWSLANRRAQDLLDKLKAVGVPLGEYVNGRIYYGIKTGYNEAFVIDNSTKNELIRQDPKSAELIKPFLAGRDVKRYEQPSSPNYLIVIPSGWTDEQRTPLPPAPSPLRNDGEQEVSPYEVGRDLERGWAWLQSNYPAIAKHLEPFAERAQKRSDKGVYWWELRPCAYYHEFEKPKIVIPAISQESGCTLDYTSHYSNDKTTIIATDSLYVLSLLNSKLINWFFQFIAATRAGGYYEYKPMYLVQAPIRKLDLENPEEKAAHDGLVAWVEKMLALKQDLAKYELGLDNRRQEVQAQIDYTDKAIDKAVYELYGLTAEEIAIVEGL